MRNLDVQILTDAVEKLFIEANYFLPDDIKEKLIDFYKRESNENAKKILEILKKNWEISKDLVYPLCQDTGMAVIFLEIGQEINFINGDFKSAIEKGVELAYKKGYLRKSVVKDPFNRENTLTNLPAIIWTEIVRGDKLKISCIPKGFGSENQSNIKMMNPNCTKEDVIDFIVNGVISSQSKGCPPAIIGVGIGGTFEYAAFLSKKALLISLTELNKDSFYADMEREIMDRINNSNVGPLGVGGITTCIGVRILSYPTHIAGLPVAYNYCCHSCRHKSIVL